MKSTIELLSLLLLAQVWMNKSTTDNCTVEVCTENGGKINSVNLQCPGSPNHPVCTTNEDSIGSSCDMCTQNATTTIICSIDGQRLSDSICHERQSYKLDTTHTGCTPSTVTLIPTPSSCMPCSTISSMSKPSENHSDMMTKETVYTTVTVYPSIASPTEQNIMTTSCHEITAALGIVAGMFMLMIAMVTVGCISVWWKMEKKRRLTISSKQTRSVINTLNHTDKTLRQFNNPLYRQGGPDELPPLPLEDGDPAYEAIPISGTKNSRSLEMSGHAISHHDANNDGQAAGCGGVSVGVASVEGCSHSALELELSQVGLEDEDIENHYHLIGSEELDRESRQQLRDTDIENHYHLLDSEREDDKNSQMLKSNNYYHVLEQNKLINQDKSDVGATESDYYLLGSVEEAEDEEEREERVYHVLEMPGNDDNDYEDPDEGELFRDYDERKREREIERSTRVHNISVTS